MVFSKFLSKRFSVSALTELDQRLVHVKRSLKTQAKQFDLQEKKSILATFLQIQIADYNIHSSLIQPMRIVQQVVNLRNPKNVFGLKKVRYKGLAKYKLKILKSEFV